MSKERIERGGPEILDYFTSAILPSEMNARLSLYLVVDDDKAFS